MNIKSCLRFIFLISFIVSEQQVQSSSAKKASWDQEYGTALYNMMFYPNTAGEPHGQPSVVIPLPNTFYAQPNAELKALIAQVYNNLDSGPKTVTSYVPSKTSLPLTKALLLINSFFAQQDMLLIIPSDKNDLWISTYQVGSLAPLGVHGWPSSYIQVLSDTSSPLAGSLTQSGKALKMVYGGIDMMWQQPDANKPLASLQYGPSDNGDITYGTLSYPGTSTGSITVKKISDASSTNTPTNNIYMSDSARYGDFLSTKILGDCAQALSGTMTYLGMRDFSVNRSGLSNTDSSYITNHLAPALNALNLKAKSSVDSFAKSVNLNFDSKAFDGVIITTINNNTQQSFAIYQGENYNQIGQLSPGKNSVALYGAAQAQGDIIFIPTTGTDGSFRVSFKSGKDIIAIANTTATSPYPTNYPPQGVESFDADFMCVQIISDDFAKGTDPQTVSTMQRTQCINLKQADGPMYVTLKIEDNMKVVDNASVSDINQNNISMNYPSIEKIVMPKNLIFPYLVLPDSIDKKQIYISTWIKFINIIMGILQTDYKQVMLPGLVNSIVQGTVESIYWVGKNSSYSDFGNIKSDGKISTTRLLGTSGKTVGKMVCAGLPGTQFLFTGDIPSTTMIQNYWSLQQPPKTSVTTSNFAKFIASDAMKYWKQYTKGVSVKLVKDSSSKSKKDLYKINANNLQMTQVNKIIEDDGILAGFLTALKTVSLPIKGSLKTGTFAIADIINAFQDNTTTFSAVSIESAPKPITIQIPKDTTAITNLVLGGTKGMVAIANYSDVFKALNSGKTVTGTVTETGITLSYTGGFVKAVAPGGGTPNLLAIYLSPTTSAPFPNFGIKPGDVIEIVKIK